MMTTMIMMVGLNILDFFVAGVSLMIGLAFFAFIASILCAAAFFNNTKNCSWGFHCKDGQYRFHEKHLHEYT